MQQKQISLAEGELAEFIIFSPQATWQVIPSQLKSLSQNTYWLNKEIKGKVTDMVIEI